MSWNDGWSNNQSYGQNPQYSQQMPMAQYPQYPQAQSYGRQQSQPNIESTFAWVYDYNGAKAFPVAPGKTVLLMDRKNPILYLKSTDMSGRPMDLEIYELCRIDESRFNTSYQGQGQQVDMSEYVKSSDLEKRVTDIMNRSMNSMNGGNNNGQSYS